MKSSPLHIVVNTRLLIGDRLDGIGIFTREVMRRVVAMHPKVRFTFLFMREPEQTFLFGPNVTPLVLGPQPREPIINMYWQEVLVPRALRRLKPDLYLSPEPMHSLRSPVPCIEVLHDLNYEHDPSVLPFSWRLYYRLMSRRYADAAARIATVSRFSKEDIVRLYNIAPDDIDVVYNGPPDPRPMPTEQRKEQVRATFSQGAPYFYFVGTLQDRKNIAGMMRGFDLFRSRVDQDVRLVVAGRRKWWTPRMKRAFAELRHPESIVFPGRIDDGTLYEVAAASLGLLYVPLFEGFGLPILEAWQAGVPVISSDVASIPEVAGDAALLVDPTHDEEIANALMALYTDPDERTRRALAGRERTSFFSWGRTAELLWETIERVVAASTGKSDHPTT